MLKQIGVLDTVTEMTARRAKNTAETASEMASVTIEEHEEPMEKAQDCPPTVSVLSKEQVVKLLKPGRGGTRRAHGAAALQGKSGSEDSLEGKFVDLVGLIPPVPTKGEFDVNKIKSSLYFFS
jgi:DNA-directed RNA polymerase